MVVRFGSFLFALPLVTGLSACGEQVTPEEQAQIDEEAVEMVRNANDADPPLEEIALDIITPADVVDFDIEGARCVYMPGTNSGPRLITRSLDAFIKLDGDVQRLAADSGSLELAQGTRTLYNGRAYVVRLEITAGEGSITIRDAYDRVVYAGSGPVDCVGGERAPDNPATSLK